MTEFDVDIPGCYIVWDIGGYFAYMRYIASKEYKSVQILKSLYFDNITKMCKCAYYALKIA